MPLKSKASEARQARVDVPNPDPAQVEDTSPAVDSTPEEAASAPKAVRAPRAARTPNPSVAERKQASERMKAILKEVKTVKTSKVSALREVEQKFETQLRNLQSEYNSLNHQLAKAAFT